MTGSCNSGCKVDACGRLTPCRCGNQHSWPSIPAPNFHFQEQITQKSRFRQFLNARISLIIIVSTGLLECVSVRRLGDVDQNSRIFLPLRNALLSFLASACQFNTLARHCCLSLEQAIRTSRSCALIASNINAREPRRFSLAFSGNAADESSSTGSLLMAAGVIVDTGRLFVMGEMRECAIMVICSGDEREATSSVRRNRG